MPDLAETSPQAEGIDELGERVIRIIAQTQRIPVESISINSTFEELNIDSLDGINIVFALENDFGIEIPDDGVKNMRSIRDSVEGVRKLVQEKAAVAQGAP